MRSTTRSTTTTRSSSRSTGGSRTTGRRIASYRWSRLRGNFEGFYRDDNGQSDPGITSLYDFPTNDPSYTAIGAPQFGYPGDIRFLGELGKGPLPLDRPHAGQAVRQLRRRPMGFSLGIGVQRSAPASR